MTTGLDATTLYFPPQPKNRKRPNAPNNAKNAKKTNNVTNKMTNSEKCNKSMRNHRSKVTLLYCTRRATQRWRLTLNLTLNSLTINRKVKRRRIWIMNVL